MVRVRGGLSRSPVEVQGATTNQSEDEDEYECSSCSQDDETTEATHYCPECEACYCKACLCDHSVLGRSRIAEWFTTTESVSGACKMCSGKAWNLVGEDMEKVMCLRHPGQTVAMYCVDHKVLCCQLCCSIDHRSCSNLESLSVAAKRDGIDKTLEAVKSKIASLERNAKTLAKESKTRTQFAHSSYTCYANQLDELKEKVIAEIDKVKNEALDRKQFYLDKFDMDMVISENIIDEMAKLETALDSTDDDEELFICIVQATKLVEEKLKEMDKVLTATVTGMFERLTEKEEEEILDVVGNSIRSRSKMTDMRFPLKTSEEGETCEIVGMCQLANGNMVLADKGNNVLKQLNNDYILIDEYELDDKPSGLCAVEDSNVAVAFENNKIELISLGTKYKTFRTIDLDISSRGIGQIAYHNGLIYIFDTTKCTCTSYYSCKCETKVHVYDKNGRSIREMPLNVRRCHVKDTEHMPIAVNGDGDKVFVAHPCGYLASFDKQGKHIVTTDHEYAEGLWLGILVDDEEFVYVTKIRQKLVHVLTFLQEEDTQIQIG